MYSKSHLGGSNIGLRAPGGADSGPFLGPFFSSLRDPNLKKYLFLTSMGPAGSYSDQYKFVHNGFTEF